MNDLVIRHGDQRIVVPPGSGAVVGRGAGSSLRVADPRVSREHLRLTWRANGWVLDSVGSGGTYAGAHRVTTVTLTGPLEVRLAAADGPVVRFEPATTPEPFSPGAAAGGPASRPPQQQNVVSALKILIPISTWARDPALRSWYRLLVAAYAMAPLIMLATLQHTSSLRTLGWVYCLYVAPLWALVFWYLIRPPGRFGKVEAAIAGFLLLAEVVLIPVLTVPWENALEPRAGSANLAGWIFGVGVAEEFTKALPLLVAAIVLLTARKQKLDVRMWTFLATLSGLMFGVYEASTIYVPMDVAQIAHGSAFGIPEFVERVFLDGLQHALWAGIAGFFIGLGANYHRQRVTLWMLGLLLPSVLHGLNDWSLSGAFGRDLWPWIVIQAVSLFLFLGYTATAAVIERDVRYMPIFRGESMVMDLPGLASPGQAHASRVAGPPGHAAGTGHAAGPGHGAGTGHAPQHAGPPGHSAGHEEIA